MKRWLLSTIVMVMGSAVVFAQQVALQNIPYRVQPVAKFQLDQPLVLPSQLQAERLQRKAIVGTEPVQRQQLVGPWIQSNGMARILEAPGDSVGFTYYDYQTNYSMPDRVVIYPPEGLAQLIWMAAVDPETQTRGSYYALVDISTDPPTVLETEKGWSRMEAERKGWPEIVQFDDGSVGTVSHTPMIFTRNTDVGVDSWTTYQAGPDESLWPRVTIDGQGYLHAIYTYSGGEKNMRLGYVRSTDGGQTWSADNEVILNGGNMPLLASADSYVIEAQGNKVVVAWVDENATLWSVQSTDNGETWGEPQPIFGPQFGEQVTVVDTIAGDTVLYVTDTVPGVGVDIDMVLDAQGMAHYVAQVVFNFIRGRAVWQNGQLMAVPGADTLYYIGVGALTVGCGYYKEGTDQIIPMAPPAGGQWDGEGTWPMYFGAYVTMSRYPQLGLGDDGTVYCVYTSVSNGDGIEVVDSQTNDTTFYLFSHLYATYYNEAHGAWSEPTMLTPNGMDASFGSLCNQVTDKLYVGYQVDGAPGTAFDGLGEGPTTVMFLAYPVSDLKGVSDVAETPDVQLRAFATPNPANGEVRIYYTLETPAPVQVELTDVLGRKIATIDQGVQGEGLHLLWLTTQEYQLNSGSYYCTIRAGERSVTLLLKVVR